MQRIILAILGDIDGCGALGLGLMQTWRGGGEATSCMDRVGEEGTYWTEDANDTNM